MASDPSVAAAITAAGRLLREKPGELLPAYLLASAVAAVARVPVFAGAAVAVALLNATGRIEPVVTAIGELEGGGLEGGESPANVLAVREALEGLVTPEVVGLIGVGVLASLAVALVVRPVSVAITQATVWAAIDGADEPLTRGVAGARRWRTFLGLLVVRLVAGLTLVGIPLAVAGLLATVSPVLALGGGVLALLGGLLFLLVSALLAFAGPAAVVEEVGAIKAIKHSVGFVRNHVGRAVALLFVGAAGFLAAGLLANVAATLGVGRLGATLVPFVVSPAFDLALTGLYVGVVTSDPSDTPAGDEPPASDTADGRGVETERLGQPERPAERDTQPASEADESDRSERVDTGEGLSPDAERESTPNAERADRPRVLATRDRGPLGAWVQSVLGDGLRAFGGVVTRHPLAMIGAVVTFLGGLAAGWQLTAPYGVQLDPPGAVGEVFGTVPIDVFLNIAANNWLVAVSGVYSGLAFGVPAATGAITNGVLVGALAGVFDPTAFLAFVAPHGVIEVPTLLVAWGFGLHLGVVGWRGLRGRSDAERVAGELRLAGRVLVGAAVLLVVAAAVEAFVTPRVAEFVL